MRGPGPNDPCWCGSGKKYKKCHRDRDAEAPPTDRKVRAGTVTPMRAVAPSIPRPSYARTGRPRPAPRIADPADRIARMRRAGRAAAEVLAEVSRAARVGVTTDELDVIAHEACIARGAYPSPLNYHGFPKAICTSVNEVILHGIPDSRPLQEGDIVGLDVTLYLDGVHGDCCATVPVGRVDDESERLLRVAEECMMKGVGAVRPGRPVSDIGRAVEAHASAHGYGVVRSFCGHGIGEDFHAEPQVLHYFEPGARELMQAGMTFTVEPMITVGDERHVVWPDGWTAVTADGKRAAQFEHTVLVTDTGVEILTALPR
ncbi:MAG: type I methionyl aminopeptidase [Deltaproteobacteria bacterium]